MTMASTKVTYVTGTAEVRRKDLGHDSQTEQHFVTEPSKPLEVAYVDGKCNCCPYGYHIDLDFLNFCSDLERGSTLKNLKKIQRTKRNLRKSMEIMLNEQEGIKADPSSAPPDVVKSTEAERLMHMVNFEQSATVNILRQIDTSVRTDMASFESRAAWRNQATTEDLRIPGSHDHPTNQNPPVVIMTRADSLSSLSSSSTVSSEAALLHQAEFIQQQQQQQQQSLHSSRAVTKVVEQPVLEMATAEMKHYSTTSSAQLTDTGTRVDLADTRQSLGRQVKQNFVTEVSATYRTPEIDSPREATDGNETSGPSLREALATSLQRIKVLEEQIKTIPILQVRLSVLKEEKRLLNLQLKASKSSTAPLTTTVGVGDDSIDFTEDTIETVPSARIFGSATCTVIATSTPRKDITPRKDLMIKSPPPTLPKPVKTASVAIGNHSVLEPYNLQPHLPTGYTIQENETAFEICSKTMFEKESLTVNKGQLLNSSIQQKSIYNIPGKDKYASNILKTTSESNKKNVQVNQTQKSSTEVVTRTIGVGDANVFEDSKMHVHEKELRTVIIGQNTAVAKRNVGIECRVATRDVGVLFKCDEEKPATRTIGVNVNYDTSGIFTSLDFKGERELRVALQGVLHRSVRSVGTTCRMAEDTTEQATITDVNVGVSVGCGDEEQRVDVEIRPAVVRKSVATGCKPDVGHTYVSTDADWVIDAGTNTYQVDSFDKGLMTDKVKQAFASTNTQPVFTHPALIQTDQNVFISLDQVRHASSNTEAITSQSRGMLTDIIPTHNVFVNTSEKVSELFREALKKEGVDNVVSEEYLQTKIETDRKTLDKVRIEATQKLREDKEMKESADSRMSDSAVQEKVTLERSDHESSFLGKSEYTKKSSKYDYGDTHYYGLEISSRSTPGSQSHISSKTSITSGKEDLNNNASSLKTVELNSPDERFSETVVEHFILTKDGKKLISEEKITTSSAGTNRSFTQFEHGDDCAMEAGTASSERSNSHSSNTDESQTGSWSSERSNSHSSTIDESQTGSWNKTNSSSYNCSKETNGFNLTGTSNITVVTDQDQDVDKLTNTSQILDSHTQTKNSLSNFESKKSERTTFSQEAAQEISGKPDAASEAVYKMRRAGSVEDFMPDDIRKYMSLNPTVPQDSGLDRDLIDILSGNSTNSSETVVTSDANGRKTYRSVTVKRISKSGGLSALPEISTYQDPDLESDSGDNRKEVVEEAFVKSEASFCGEQLEASGRGESGVSSSATATREASGWAESGVSSSVTATREASGWAESGVSSSATATRETSCQAESSVSSSATATRETSWQAESGVSSPVTTTTDTSGQAKSGVSSSVTTTTKASWQTESGVFSSATATTDTAIFLKDKGQLWSTLSSCAKTEGHFDSSIISSMEMAKVASVESRELTESIIHTTESSKRQPVLKSIMKHSTESQCASGKKAITFAESVTGGTGSSSEEDNNCSDADSTDSFDEGSYDGQAVEVKYYSKEEVGDSSGVQVLDQNIREIYELSDEVKNACSVVGTYLTDSTSIQTKQLNASQEILQQEWFQLSSHKLSSAHKVEDFLSSVNEISSRLLEYIINVADANGNTAIHYCISHGNFEIASLLLDSKVCDTNRRNKAGYTPIMLAGLATVQDPGQYDVIRRLLSLGEVNARAIQTQQTALMLAATHGRTEMVKLLIEEGADVNLQDEDGSTALMCACEHGHLEVVNMLLTHPGIDVNLTDSEKSTALSIAMEAGHKDIGVVLYKHLNFPKVPSPGSHKKEKKFQLFHSK